MIEYFNLLIQLTITRLTQLLIAVKILIVKFDSVFHGIYVLYYCEIK